MKISRSASTTEKATEEAQSAKQTASRATRAAADSNTLGQLLLAQTLAGAGVANDAAKVSAIKACVGLERFLNPKSLGFRQVAKQLKYNGNPRCWPQFGQEFKPWVKGLNPEVDQFSGVFLDRLEGLPANIWLRLWSAREETISPVHLGCYRGKSSVWNQWQACTMPHIVCIPLEAASLLAQVNVEKLVCSVSGVSIVTPILGKKN